MAGRLLIRRHAQYVDIIRRYRLYVDGVKIGTIKRSEEVGFDLVPGEHEVVARIDWCRSNLLRVVIREGETTEVEVGASACGTRMFGALYDITFGRSEYLYLSLGPRGFEVVLGEAAAG